MVSLHSDAQNLSRRGMQDRVKTQKLGGRFQGTATPLKIATSARRSALERRSTLMTASASRSTGRREERDKAAGCRKSRRSL